MNCTTIKNVSIITSGVYRQATPDGEIPYLQVRDFLTSEPLGTALKIPVSEVGCNNFLQKGDLLFACKGSTFLCVVYNSDLPAVASTALFVIRITCKDILPEYLCWYLNRPSMQAYFRTSQLGTGTPLIRKSSVGEVEIPVPGMDIQEKIVTIARLSERETQLHRDISNKKKELLDQALMNIVKQ